MPDYIPDEDDEFDTYAVTKFAPYATANATALGIATADITALTAGVTAWTYAWTGHTNTKSAFQSATINKNEKRAALEELIRKIAANVQANQAVTDPQKESLGVTVRKTTRTPSPIPTTPPSMQRIDTSTRGILRLFFVDSATPDSRSKPPGVQSCEIREQIGGTAPTDPEAMSLLAIETRMPYRADFEAGDIGKTVYFAMRWLNTRGKPGPWSQIYSAIVPS
jgi:hypothetical protein